MLDPDLVLAEIVAAFQSIPSVVASLNGNPNLIVGHHYYYGIENSLAQTIYTQTSPSILVAYKDLLGGSWDQSTLWKHRIEVYIRPGNMASPIIGGQPLTQPYMSPPHLWYLMMNSPLGTPPGSPPHWTVGLKIRNTTLLAGSLILMDTPTLTFRQDQDGADLFCGSCVWPEYGDQ